jgi:CheY-like chemotaxis protein
MKVLIVDDEPLVRRSLEKVFKKMNHEVHLADDGLSGVEQWKSLQPDGVVIDVLMPGLSGPEVIAEVQPPKTTAVILISAYSGDYDPDSVKQLGADLFIEKPFESIGEIVTNLERVWSVKNK